MNFLVLIDFLSKLEYLARWLDLTENHCIFPYYNVGKGNENDREFIDEPLPHRQEFTELTSE
jgi:hypothetical protein